MKFYEITFVRHVQQLLRFSSCIINILREKILILCHVFICRMLEMSAFIEQFITSFVNVTFLVRVKRILNFMILDIYLRIYLSIIIMIVNKTKNLIDTTVGKINLSKQVLIDNFQLTYHFFIDKLIFRTVIDTVASNSGYRQKSVLIMHTYQMTLIAQFQ